MRSDALDFGASPPAEGGACGSSGGAPYRSSGVTPFLLPPLPPNSPMCCRLPLAEPKAASSSSSSSWNASLSRYGCRLSPAGPVPPSLRFSTLRPPATSLNARGRAPAVPPPATMTADDDCSGGDPVCGLLGLLSGVLPELPAPRFGVVVALPFFPLAKPTCCAAAASDAAAESFAEEAALLLCGAPAADACLPLFRPLRFRFLLGDFLPPPPAVRTRGCSVLIFALWSRWLEQARDVFSSIPSFARVKIAPTQLNSTLGILEDTRLLSALLYKNSRASQEYRGAQFWAQSPF